MNENELITRTLTGEDQAFNELVQPYILTLKKTAYLLLHDKNLSEDAVQEALLQAYQHLERYDASKAKFHTWLNGIVINMVGKIKRKKRWNLALLSDRIVDETKQPDEETLLKEEQKELYQFVQKLNFKHQSVIILYYYQELTVEEIAKTLKIKEGTVKSRLHQARQKLKNMYEHSPTERSDQQWKES